VKAQVTVNKAAVVFQFELRAVLSRRVFWVTTALLPAVGILIIVVGRIVASAASDDTKHVGYVDHWGRLPAEMPRESPLRSYPDEVTAKTALLARQIEAYYIVPADYVGTGVILRYKLASSAIFSEGEAAPSTLSTLLVQALVADQVSPDVAARVQKPAVVETVRLDTDGGVVPEERDELTRFLVPYILSILLLVSIGMTSGLLVQGIAEEKQTRTIEILLSSVSSSALMVGKILGLGAAGVIQILVWLISLWVLASAAGSALSLPSEINISPATLGLGALFFLLGYFFFATILVGVGAISTSPQEVGQIGGFVTFSAAIPLILTSVVTNEPNGLAARVLTYVPFTAPGTVMLRMSAVSIPWFDILAGAAILALSIFAAMLLSARVFRTFLLLYGRKPSLSEIWRALRNAG
jgi:ABC-2 type transport system permease protein